MYSVSRTDARGRSSRALRPSGRLRGKIALIAPAFGKACEGVFRHPQIVDLLPEYLIEIHTIIRSTTPLMEAGIARAEAMAPADPVAGGVAAYLRRHVEEERFHDKWLLEDLELMGMPPAAVLERLPTATVASLAGAQYYWALHYHPITLLGYFAFAEGFPPSGALVEELIERTGYPRAAFRTFIVHGELDPGHREEIDRTIDGLPLEPGHEVALGLSAMTTGRLLTKTLVELVEDVGTAERPLGQASRRT
jgi:hypothetical protein